MRMNGLHWYIVYGVYVIKREKYLLIMCIRWSCGERSKQIETHKNQVCVVGNDQCLFTNSVVVTFVQVMHNDTTCPAISERTNRLVHRLRNRRQELRVRDRKEDQSIGGLSSSHRE